MQSMMRFNVGGHIGNSSCVVSVFSVARAEESKEKDEAEKWVISASAEEGKYDGKMDECSENDEECVFHH